jgi:hypothetical protein
MEGVGSSFHGPTVGDSASVVYAKLQKTAAERITRLADHYLTTEYFMDLASLAKDCVVVKKSRSDFSSRELFTKYLDKDLGYKEAILDDIDDLVVIQGLDLETNKEEVKVLFTAFLNKYTLERSDWETFLKKSFHNDRDPDLYRYIHKIFDECTKPMPAKEGKPAADLKAKYAGKRGRDVENQPSEETSYDKQGAKVKRSKTEVTPKATTEITAIVTRSGGSVSRGGGAKTEDSGTKAPSSPNEEFIDWLRMTREVVAGVYQGDYDKIDLSNFLELMCWLFKIEKKDSDSDLVRIEAVFKDLNNALRIVHPDKNLGKDEAAAFVKEVITWKRMINQLKSQLKEDKASEVKEIKVPNYTKIELIRWLNHFRDKYHGDYAKLDSFAAMCDACIMFDIKDDPTKDLDTDLIRIEAVLKALTAAKDILQPEINSEGSEVVELCKLIDRWKELINKLQVHVESNAPVDYEITIPNDDKEELINKFVEARAKCKDYMKATRADAFYAMCEILEIKGYHTRDAARFMEILNALIKFLTRAQFVLHPDKNRGDETVLDIIQDVNRWKKLITEQKERLTS